MMKLMKRTKRADDSKRVPLNAIAWLIVACIVLVTPLSGCGNSSSKDIENSGSSVSHEEETSSFSAEPVEPADSVSPSVKAALDEYEIFMNEYCDFMERYSGSGYSASMLSDYSKFMSRYAEVTKKFEAIDTTGFSAADSAYYAEVVARTTQRLSEIL